LALVYKSWREYVITTFTDGQYHVYRLLDAVKIDWYISPRGDMYQYA
jgi:hypothetical protein